MNSRHPIRLLLLILVVCGILTQFPNGGMLQFVLHEETTYEVIDVIHPVLVNSTWTPAATGNDWVDALPTKTYGTSVLDPPSGAGNADAASTDVTEASFAETSYTTLETAGMASLPTGWTNTNGYVVGSGGQSGAYWEWAYPNSGTLRTKGYDLSAATGSRITFYWKATGTNALENGDLTLRYVTSSLYTVWTSTGSPSSWTQVQYSQASTYSTFKWDWFYLLGTSGEEGGVDTITVESYLTATYYRLEMVFRFDSVDYIYATESLTCDFDVTSTAETLDFYGGTISNPTTQIANAEATDFTVSVTITGATYYVKIVDEVRSTDTDADTWKLDQLYVTITNNVPQNDGTPTLDNPDDGDNMYAKYRQYQVTQHSSDLDGYSNIINMTMYMGNGGAYSAAFAYIEDTNSFETVLSVSGCVTLNTTGSSAVRSGTDIDATYVFTVNWNFPDMTDMDFRCHTVDTVNSDMDTYYATPDVETRLEYSVAPSVTDDDAGTVNRGDLDETFTIGGTLIYYTSVDNNPPSNQVDVWVSCAQYGTTVGPWSDTALDSGAFVVTCYADNEVGQDTYTVKPVAEGDGSAGTSLYYTTDVTVTYIADQIEVYSCAASDNRTNIGEQEYPYFQLRLKHDNHLLNDGTNDAVQINGSAATWGVGGTAWYKYYTYSTVLGYDFVVTSASEATYGVTSLNSASATTYVQNIIWDEVEVYYFVSSDYRVNTGTTSEIRLRARLAYDGHTLSSGDTVTLNTSLSMSWDAGNGWFEYTTSAYDTVGARCFNVTAVSEATHTITVLLWHSGVNPSSDSNYLTTYEKNAWKLQTFTVELWYMSEDLSDSDVDGVSTSQCGWENYAGGTLGGFLIPYRNAADADNLLRFYAVYNNTGGTQSTTYKQYTTFQAWQWYHFVYTVNSTGYIWIYIDSVLRDAWQAPSFSAWCYINPDYGNVAGYYGNNHLAHVDEVRFYNTAYTTTQAYQAYYGIHTETGLVSYWSFDGNFTDNFGSYDCTVLSTGDPICAGFRVTVVWDRLVTTITADAASVSCGTQVNFTLAVVYDYDDVTCTTYTVQIARNAILWYVFTTANVSLFNDTSESVVTYYYNATTLGSGVSETLFGLTALSTNTEEVEWTNASPLNVSLDVDYDDTDNLYARYRFYEAVVVVSDSDGYAGLDYITLSLRTVGSDWWVIKWTQSSDLFEEFSGDTRFALGSWSYSVLAGNTATLHVFFKIEWAHGSISNAGWRVVTYDDVAASDTDDYADNEEVICSIRYSTTPYLSDDRDDVGTDTLWMYGIVVYGTVLDTGTYHPLANETDVWVLHDVSGTWSGNVDGSGVFNITSIGSSASVRLNTYTIKVVIQDAGSGGTDLYYTTSLTDTFITDTIDIYLTIADDTRVSYGASTMIAVQANLTYSNHLLGSGDLLFLNDTQMTWNGTHFVLEATFYGLGLWWFYVNSTGANEATYGVTVIEASVPTDSVIWDRVVITNFWVSDDRTNTDETEYVYASLVLDYDDSPVEGGTVTLNSTYTMSWDGSKWSRGFFDDDVMNWSFYISGAEDSTYGISYLYNVTYVTITWDTVYVTYAGEDDGRVSIDGSTYVLFQLALLYDDHPLGAGDSAYANSTLLTWNGTYWRLQVTNDTVVKNIWAITSASEATYTITALNASALYAEVIWDRIACNYGYTWGTNLNDGRTYPTDSELGLVFRLYLEYDITYLSSGDSVWINGTEATYFYYEVLSYYCWYITPADLGWTDAAAQVITIVTNAYESGYGISALNTTSFSANSITFVFDWLYVYAYSRSTGGYSDYVTDVDDTATIGMYVKRMWDDIAVSYIYGTAEINSTACSEDVYMFYITDSQSATGNWTYVLTYFYDSQYQLYDIWTNSTYPATTWFVWDKILFDPYFDAHWLWITESSYLYFNGTYQYLGDTFSGSCVVNATSRTTPYLVTQSTSGNHTYQLTSIYTNSDHAHMKAWWHGSDYPSAWCIWDDIASQDTTWEWFYVTGGIETWLRWEGRPLSYEVNSTTLVPENSLTSAYTYSGSNWVLHDFGYVDAYSNPPELFFGNFTTFALVSFKVEVLIELAGHTTYTAILWYDILTVMPSDSIDVNTNFEDAGAIAYITGFGGENNRIEICLYNGTRSSDSHAGEGVWVEVVVMWYRHDGANYVNEDNWTFHRYTDANGFVYISIPADYGALQSDGIYSMWDAQTLCDFVVTAMGDEYGVIEYFFPSDYSPYIRVLYRTSQSDALTVINEFVCLKWVFWEGVYLTATAQSDGVHFVVTPAYSIPDIVEYDLGEFAYVNQTGYGLHDYIWVIDANSTSGSWSYVVHAAYDDIFVPDVLTEPVTYVIRPIQTLNPNTVFYYEPTPEGYWADLTPLLVYPQVDVQERMFMVGEDTVALSGYARVVPFDYDVYEYVSDEFVLMKSGTVETHDVFIWWDRRTALVAADQLWKVYVYTDNTNKTLNGTYSKAVDAFGIVYWNVEYDDVYANIFCTTTWQNATLYIYDNGVMQAVSPEAEIVQYRKLTTEDVHVLSVLVNATGDWFWKNVTYSVAITAEFTVTSFNWDTGSIFTVSGEFRTNWQNATITIYNDGQLIYDDTEGTFWFPKARTEGVHLCTVYIYGGSQSVQYTLGYTFSWREVREASLLPPPPVVDAIVLSAFSTYLDSQVVLPVGVFDLCLVVILLGCVGIVIGIARWFVGREERLTDERERRIAKYLTSS